MFIVETYEMVFPQKGRQKGFVVTVYCTERERTVREEIHWSKQVQLRAVERLNEDIESGRLHAFHGNDLVYTTQTGD